MKNSRTIAFLLLFLLLENLVGCVGTQTFTTAARAGDTVALPVGWLNLKRENLTITITPSSGAPVTYLPNDPAVRGVVKLYPDPSSGLVVGERTGQDLGNSDSVIAGNINGYVTNGDREWWQSSIFLDLPSSLPSGKAVVSVVDSTGAQVYPIYIDILPGTGSSNLFSVYGPMGSYTLNLPYVWPNVIKSLETTARYQVTFNSYQDANGNDVVPHSIQAEFTHMTGVGKPWVVNARGDIKNVIWSDDGTNLKVMVTPTKGKTLGLLVQEKFYIAGGITGLTLTNLKAYDINGNVMAGVTATVTQQ